MPSFDTITTTTCDISRVGAMVAGHRPLPTVVYSGVQCLVPYAVKPDLKFKLGVKPATKLVQTVIRGEYVVLENDTIIIGSGTYPVVTVESWYVRPRDTNYVTITMEQAVPNA